MLKGTRINLRLMRETDLEDYIKFSHDVAARGDYFPLNIDSESTIRSKFREHGYWSEAFRTMLIVDAVTDRMIGTISAFKPVFYQNSLEIGYILYDVTRRGEGIMAEAVHVFSDYLFRLLSINRIQLQIESLNIASRRTAEKAGFTHEGTLRQCLMSEGKHNDMEMFSLLRSEFAALKAKN